MTDIDVAFISFLMFLVSKSGDRIEWLIEMSLLYVLMFLVSKSGDRVELLL